MKTRSPVRPFDLEGLLLSLEHNVPKTVLATPEIAVIPFILCAIRSRLQRPLIVIVPDRARMAQLVDGMATWAHEQWQGLPPILSFEPNDVSPYREICPARELARGRVAAAYRLHMDLGLSAIVLPASALLLRTLAASVLEERTMMASSGCNLDRVELCEMLVYGGYERVPIVEDPGTFAVRGGVIDVWSPVYEQPVRIDLFGDDVESLRFFDPRHPAQRRYARRLHHASGARDSAASARPGSDA